MRGRTVPGIAVLLALLALSCSDPVPLPPTPTPRPEARVTSTPDGLQPVPNPGPGRAEATPTATPKPVPEALQGLPVAPLRLGDAAPFPEDLALIIETGCYGCRGLTDGLFRVYRDASGVIRAETLYAVRDHGLPWAAGTPVLPVPEAGGILGFAVSQDASEMVLALCRGDECPLLAPPAKDATTILIRSRDGGVSWSQLGRVEGVAFVVGLVGAQVLLFQPPAPALDGEPPRDPMYTLYPDGQVIDPPPGALLDEWPLVLPTGALLWPAANGRLLREDGSTFLDLGAGARYEPGRPVPADRSGSRLAISWRLVSAAAASSFLLLTTEDGTLIRALETEELTTGAGYDIGFFGNVVVDDRFLDIAIRSGIPTAFPAWIDVDGGSVHPFYDPFAEVGFLPGSLRVVAVQKGPFARVVGTESCLNVREGPSTFARVLDCAADGVLLRISTYRNGILTSGSGRTAEPLDGFIEVITQDGTLGYAHVAYLSYAAEEPAPPSVAP